MKAALALLLLALALPALADGNDRDHDRARLALERGEVLPLGDILDIAVADSDGRVIEVELERDDGRWIYELTQITSEGRLMELEIDGATGRILDRDFKHKDH